MRSRSNPWLFFLVLLAPVLATGTSTPTQDVATLHTASIGIYFDPLFSRTKISDPLVGHPFKAWVVVKGMPALSAWEAAISFPPPEPIWVVPKALTVVTRTLLPLGSVNQGSVDDWIVNLPACTSTGAENALAVVEYVLIFDHFSPEDPTCPGLACTLTPIASTPSRFSPAAPGWFDCASAGAPFAQVTGGLLGGCGTSGNPPHFVYGPTADPASGWDPLTVQFDAAAWDDDTPAAQLQYYWFFDDGGFAIGQAPQHTYTTQGTYLVWVNVTDGNNDDSATIPVTITSVSDAAPRSSSAAAVRLHAVQPNPCARSAQIRFDLAQPGPVRLGIYNGAGRLVREVLSGWQPGGTHTATWDGRDRTGTRVASGVYVVRLRSSGHDQSVRMALIP